MLEDLNVIKGSFQFYHGCKDETEKQFFLKMAEHYLDKLIEKVAEQEKGNKAK